MDEKTLNELKDRLLYLKREIQQRIKDNNDRVRSLESGDEADFSNSISYKDLTYNLIEKDRAQLIEIEEALYRMENNTYGICERCKEPIEIERLKAKPTAKYCAKCKRIIESNR
ncbi:MAG: TraR/DksA family transcriptional regulator [Desulfurella sp.]|jgi:DnaK suppressor protein|uniref:Transcriptional regulator, TraR/DksA family n=1 Tax=Desulfurella multipotens TaxID=79269 RepID=A0A1G6KQ59_9BACT|nr:MULTISPECIES: TraR/DksA C4-type zinc finger protein [Desulfurella]AHF96743.1 molecular chaperone DnaK [Desulfurella acetivorans A63]HEX13246.1 TraR/DksA family transcriptional regulator [Desulfurella acetivorans]PMP62856.1 MAG: molecular chaperone DnaK suppressor DksA [Desulfurella multipotens]PMP87697.1 MAG: molecular chaperone DnaK suppressor DksA [Desulfurella sp.]SDC32476.1 transcriptional regulator, TraR/DksA family [Desulfurella multipotens]